MDVGIEIPKSSGLRAQVASYKMMNDLSYEEVSSDQMDPLYVLIS